MPYIAVLTSGGDSPGMNAAVTAIARSAALLNMPLLGVDRGFNGLLGKSPKTDFMELNLEKALDIADLPGTQLRTARCVEFKDKAVQARAAKLLRDMDVAGLIVIGGVASTTVAAPIKLAFVAGEMNVEIQASILDKILPGLVPMLLTLLCYWLIDKKGWSANKIILLILAIAAVCVPLGIM